MGYNKVQKVSLGLDVLLDMYPRGKVSAQTGTILYGKISKKLFEKNDKDYPYYSQQLKEYGWKYYERCQAYLIEV